MKKLIQIDKYFIKIIEYNCFKVLKEFEWEE